MLRRASVHVAWPALGLVLAAACGGATQTPGDSGSGGADGVGGTPPGSGAATSTGATSGDGGNPSTDGGSPGTGGDGPLGGSSNGTGGAVSTEHLVSLGADCTTPGTFACSAENELLALVCEADGTWGVRETCESGEHCDFTDSADPGLCRAVLPACETGSTEPFCGATGVQVCEPGGFETEVLEACGPGTMCTDTGCVLVADECPGSTALGCGDYCTLDDSGCAAPDCSDSSVTLSFVSSSTRVLRLPTELECTADSDSLCEDGGGVVVHPVADIPIVGGGVEQEWVKVTLSPGWEMSRRYYGVSEDSGVCVPAVDGCLLLPPGVPSSPDGTPTRQVIFQPQTDPPIARNVTFEIVPEGTTCD